MDKIDPRLHDDVKRHLLDMGYDSLHNYIVPGLVSTLIAEDPHASSKVRLFRNTRTQDQHITPHGHRFDLACMVLQGTVENTIYATIPYSHGGTSYTDEFAVSRIRYLGTPGRYDRDDAGFNHYARTTSLYQPGQWYFMDYTAIHSIKFSKDALVLVFEGDSKTDETFILEPVVNGKAIRTFNVEDWMFKS